jgi:lipid II:glycine glycyltransferase (peptidoglycan interpeptide bridge formation enzyme)
LNGAYDVPASCGDVVERGRTVSIDLTLTPEDLWAQTRADHRRNISKARRMGMTASMEDFEANLDTFLQMYFETMDRTGATQYYYFPRDYFVTLKQALAGNVCLCMVRGVDGEPLSGGLFTTCCGIVQYHLSGTFTSAIQLRPSKLMLDFVRTWAKQAGNRVFHLGGGFGAREDSVFDFKAGFSSMRHPYYTWQFILNDGTYSNLARQRQNSASSTAAGDFFPLYRA